MGIVGEEGDIVAAARAGDSQWADLMQAAIGGVLHAGERIEEEVALEGAFEVFGDPLLLVVHG
jgi:predicted regulator of Ras-like GTPase activity (Roadblock/LC7/MglB family)